MGLIADFNHLVTDQFCQLPIIKYLAAEYFSKCPSWHVLVDTIQELIIDVFCDVANCSYPGSLAKFTVQAFFLSSHEAVANAYSMVVAEASETTTLDDAIIPLVLQQVIVACEVVFVNVSSSGGVFGLRTDCPVEEGPLWPCGAAYRLLGFALKATGDDLQSLFNPSSATFDFTKAQRSLLASISTDFISLPQDQLPSFDRHLTRGHWTYPVQGMWPFAERLSDFLRRRLTISAFCNARRHEVPSCIKAELLRHPSDGNGVLRSWRTCIAETLTQLELSLPSEQVSDSLYCRIVEKVFNANVRELMKKVITHEALERKTKLDANKVLPARAALLAK